jgi:type II secretory pathway predicted ATPase ExeA
MAKEKVMYLTYYNLQKLPFSKEMDSSGIILAPGQEEAYSRLLYVSTQQLFAVFTGDCGSGKTTVLRLLKDSLDEKDFSFLYLTDSKLTPRNFYNGLLNQLGQDGAFYRGDSRLKLHKEIEFIRTVRHQKLVVVVDEAHLLDKEMLEETRFLLNWKMDSLNPLALILTGQTELEQNLDKKSSAAIRQRIDFRCRLAPLTLAETADYINNHLNYAGTQNHIFSEAAINEVFSFSAGSARLINKVCSNCLMYGALNKMDIIDDNTVRTIIEHEFK